MATNYIVNGDSSITFGMASADIQINGTAQTLGYAQSAGAPSTGDKWEGRDGDGRVVSTVLYNENGSLTAKFLLKSGVQLPKRGDTITVGDKTGTIEEVNKQWSNTEGTLVDITGTWYEGITA